MFNLEHKYVLGFELLALEGTQRVRRANLGSVDAPLCTPNFAVQRINGQGSSDLPRYEDAI